MGGEKQTTPLAMTDGESDSLQPETVSDVETTQPDTTDGDGLWLETDSEDEITKPTTKATPNLAHKLTALCDMIQAEIWMQREKNPSDPAADQ